MDRKEHLEKREELDRKLSNLLLMYISKNSPLPIGTKVKVNYDSQPKPSYGFVIGYDTFYDEITPIVAKIRKNGEPDATKRLRVTSMKQIEICQEKK